MSTGRHSLAPPRLEVHGDVCECGCWLSRGLELESPGKHIFTSVWLDFVCLIKTRLLRTGAFLTHVALCPTGQRWPRHTHMVTAAEAQHVLPRKSQRMSSFLQQEFT